MARAIVLASGSGSNFEAIARRLSQTDHTLSGLICDRPGAYCIERANALNIRHWTVSYAGRRQDAEEEIDGILDEQQPDLIVLAGFMKVLPAWLVDRWLGRIVNIHPSLLPAYPGLNAIERSFFSGDGEIGVTIHYVDAGVDTGPIIEQHRVQRSEAPDLERATARIHELEHRHYPEVVARLLDSRRAAIKGESG